MKMVSREWAKDKFLISAAIIAVVFAVGAGFKLYTGHVWEDFLITFRFSDNFLKGNGLVYNIGEKVFGFTSPLNGLLPIVFKFTFGGEDYSRALWGFVAVSLLVWAAGIIAYAKLLYSKGELRPQKEVAIYCALSLLTIKMLAFAVNGQEAGLWAGFLLMAFCASLRPAVSSLVLGLAWGGMLWTRPDSPVQILLLAGASLLFAREPRGGLIIKMAQAAGIAALLYSPWLAFTSWYYGSPIPNTVIAKQNMFGPIDAGALGRLTHIFRVLPEAIAAPFEPIYSRAGGWPPWTRWGSAILGVFCAGYWLIAGKDRIGRSASFIFMGSVFYLAVIGASGLIFPWYSIPCCTMGALVIARFINGSFDRFGKYGGYTAHLIFGAVLFGLATEFFYSAIQLRVHQDIVENGTRRQVGLWLKEHVRSDQTIFLEPIGYIGYYSERHIVDFPGLVSPQVVRARHRPGGDVYSAIRELRPDWIVMRPTDASNFQLQPDLAVRYVAVVLFDSLPQLAKYAWLPGYGFLSADARFAIFRRKTRID